MSCRIRFNLGCETEHEALVRGYLENVRKMRDDWMHRGLTIQAAKHIGFYRMDCVPTETKCLNS